MAEVDHEEQRDVERWAAIGAARRAPAAGENAGAPALHVYNFCHELLEVAVEPLVVGRAEEMGGETGEQRAGASEGAPLADLSSIAGGKGGSGAEQGRPQTYWRLGS